MSSLNSNATYSRRRRVLPAGMIARDVIAEFFFQMLPQRREPLGRIVAIDRRGGHTIVAVRAVLPFLASPEPYTWRHFFDDAHFVRDNDSSNFRSSSSRPSARRIARSGRRSRRASSTTRPGRSPRPTR